MKCMVGDAREERSGNDSQGECVEPHRYEPTASGQAVRLSTLVIGLWNPLITDDSVGLRVKKHLESELSDWVQWVLEWPVA